MSSSSTTESTGSNCNTNNELRSILANAIECNNIGVALLKAGFLRDSLDTFKGAAQILHPIATVLRQSSSSEAALAALRERSSTAKATTASRPSDQKAEEAAAAAGAASILGALPTIKDQSCSLALEARKKLCAFVGSNDISIQSLEKDLMSSIGTDSSVPCSDPILIPSSVVATSSPRDNEDELISCFVESAVIVYNMGLTYQMVGSGPCLQKALCLYEMAMCLILSPTNDGLLSSASNSSGLDLSFDVTVSMACLNNSALIHYTQGNYQACQRCLNTLSRYATAIPALATGGMNDEPQQPKRPLVELHRLYLNSMFLKEPTVAKAA